MPVNRSDFPYPLRTVDGGVDVEADTLTVTGTATFLGPVAIGGPVAFTDIVADTVTADSITSPLANLTIVNAQDVNANTVFSNNIRLLNGNALQAVQTDVNKDLITISNTGIGDNVLATSPSLITPNIGAASATSLATGSLTSTTPIAASSGGTGQSLLSAVTVGKATNIKAGVLGDIPVQTAADTTTFIGVGLNGTILTSNGIFPVYQDPAIVSLTTGVSGVLPVVNGGTGQTSLASVTVGKSTNVAGGVNGQVVVQTGVGTSGFVGPGSSGQILTSNGTTSTFQNPAVVSLTTGVSGTLPVVNGGTGQTSLASVTVGNATSAVTSTNIAGGVNGQVHIQTGVGTTGFVGPGSSGQILTSNGTTSTFQNPAVVSLTTGVSGVLPVANGGTGQTSLASVTVGNATSAVTSTNIAGGANGRIVAQTGVGTTGFITPGAIGTVLRSTGTTATFSLPTPPTFSTFTTGGAANYTSPANCILIYVVCTGAGGGGGGSTGVNGEHGGGGGGGGSAFQYFAPGTYAMTYGAKGIGGAAGANGTDGGDSTFDGLTGPGGKGGDGGSSATKMYGGKGGGTGLSTTISGSCGQPPGTQNGGIGGRCFANRGGEAGFYKSAGATPGNGQPGGGGGGAAKTGGPQSGGDGGNGLIQITEFY